MRQALTPALAAELYSQGMSACMIAQQFKITREGAERQIGKGGLGGNQWCVIHRKYERVELRNNFDLSLRSARTAGRS